jgi:hypothetical protein
MLTNWSLQNRSKPAEVVAAQAMGQVYSDMRIYQVKKQIGAKSSWPPRLVLNKEAEAKRH